MLRPRIQIAALLAGLLAVGPLPAEAQGGAPYGRRDPATCTPLYQPPTVEQAVQLIRCEREVVTYGEELWLMEDMKIDFGEVTTWMEMYDEMILADADTSKPVYRIHGSFTWTVCRTIANAGAENCRVSVRPEQTGACWQTRAEGWTCFLMG